jgi:DtxR family Mn-dependent transcriptional regulator
VKAQTAVEDYVKTIYSHTEWQPDPITPSVLAARLGLVPSTVTEMVKKLAASGLVDHRPYGAIELTAEGRTLALRMLRRHRLIETWLVESFGYGWDQVHDEAEVLEHALSDRLLEAIAVQLGQPVRDPHGDAIPGADGSVHQPDAVLLRDAPLGARGRVVRISDRSPQLLRELAAQSIAVDTVVALLQPTDAATIRVRVPGGERELDPRAATSIWIALE